GGARRPRGGPGKQPRGGRQGLGDGGDDPPDRGGGGGGGLRPQGAVAPGGPRGGPPAPPRAGGGAGGGGPGGGGGGPRAARGVRRVRDQRDPAVMGRGVGDDRVRAGGHGERGHGADRVR